MRRNRCYPLYYFRLYIVIKRVSHTANGGTAGLDCFNSCRSGAVFKLNMSVVYNRDFLVITHDNSKTGKAFMKLLEGRQERFLESCIFRSKRLQDLAMEVQHCR